MTIDAGAGKKDGKWESEEEAEECRWSREVANDDRRRWCGINSLHDGFITRREVPCLGMLIDLPSQAFGRIPTTPPLLRRVPSEIPTILNNYCFRTAILPTGRTMAVLGQNDNHLRCSINRSPSNRTSYMPAISAKEGRLSCMLREARTVIPEVYTEPLPGAINFPQKGPCPFRGSILSSEWWTKSFASRGK
ncbi:unnamed protein product, partial [Nesidiocoris tenuis]